VRGRAPRITRRGVGLPAPGARTEVRLRAGVAGSRVPQPALGLGQGVPAPR
jgi:hypothetical protein